MRRRIHTETDEPGIHRDTKASESTATVDPPAAEVAVGAMAAEVGRGEAGDQESVSARIADLEGKVKQEHDAYLRALADFQNFRRRSEEQRAEVAQFANRELILGLLPVLDNFERALAAAEKNQSYEAVMGGVGLILRQLQDFLKRHGVEPIEAVGKEFDPEQHEAVARVEDSDHPENTVVDEVQRGYRMHSRVLRPSLVRVARSE